MRAIPSLDGLRAVAIACVLLSHFAASSGAPPGLAGPALRECARLGVQLFFVISGYLITALLLREARETSRISILGFYGRRAVRILPAFLACVAVTGALVGAGLLHVPREDFVRALTFTMNVGPDPSWPLGHFWSLSTEEQFYLVWPLTLATLGTRGGGAIAVLAVAFPSIRFVALHFAPWLSGPIWSVFPNGADGIAAGCLLALGWDWLTARRWHTRLVSGPAAWVLLLVPVATIALADHPRPYFALALLQNIPLILLLDRVVRQPADAVGRFLNRRSVATVGVLSYSAYLWQQMFTDPDGASVRFPLNVAGFVVATGLSFYCIERPLLGLRVRLRSRVSRHSTLAP